MNRTQRILAGAAGILALAGAGAVFAAPAGCEGMGMGPGGGRMGMMAPRGEPGAMAEQHLARLKTELKITAQQEAAWNTFAGRSIEQAKAMRAQMEAQQKATPPATAPERMAQHLEQMKLRETGLAAMQVALRDLYAQLSPEQRAVLDKDAAHRGGPGGMGGHRHG